MSTKPPGVNSAEPILKYRAAGPSDFGAGCGSMIGADAAAAASGVFAIANVVSCTGAIACCPSPATREDASGAFEAGGFESALVRAPISVIPSAVMTDA